LAGQILERILHVAAQMGNARTDRKENKHRRKNRKEVVERHPAALPKNLILPALARGSP
jgi:hypothetical protein